MQGEGTSSMSLGPRRTASTLTMDVRTGTYDFEIHSYNLIKAMGVGSFIRSANFTIGGLDWAIRFYPNSTCEEHSDKVTVFLELMSSNTEVKAHYNIQFIGRDPKIDCNLTWHPCGGARLFKSRNLTGGHYRPRHMGYMLRSKLEERFVQDDHVTIHCDLTVMRPTVLSENVAHTEIPVPPSDIAVHFGKLLDDKKGADVTFAVEEQTFHAHKAVLAARSPVFMEMFYESKISETGPRSVRVENVEPLVFNALLHFIYTDTLPWMMHDPFGHDYGVMIMKLLVAANTYSMDRLKLMCESILAKKLNIETVGEIGDIANRCNCQKLKEACIGFMSSLSEKDFMLTCTMFKSSYPSFMTALLDRISRIHKT